MSGGIKAVVGAVGVLAVAGLAIWMTSDDEGVAVSEGRPVAGGQTTAGQPSMDLPAADSRSDRAPEPINPQAELQAEAEAASLAAAALQAAEAAEQARLSGRVVGPQGRPVADARVVFHAAASRFIRLGGGDEIGAIDTPETRTDREGRFELEVEVSEPGADNDMLPGEMRQPSLVVVHSAFATLVHGLNRVAGGEQSVGTLSLAAGAQVTGSVVDESGRPIAGARVSGRNTDASQGGLGLLAMLSNTIAEGYSTDQTGADGRFTITGLKAGEASVTAAAEGKRVGGVTGLELDTAASTDAGQIVLQDGAVIAGYVTDEDGKPVEGASVRVSAMTRIVMGAGGTNVSGHQMGHEMQLRATTDASGWFELVGLGDGPFTVYATADGFARGQQENVTVGTKDLGLTVARLGGVLLTVRSATDNQPIQGATVVAEALPSSGWRMVSGDALDVLEGQAALEAAGLTDEEPAGRYFVSGVGPTGAELLVRAEGYAVESVDGPAATAGVVPRLDVLLPPESVIEGYVLDSTGAPVDGALVRLSDHDASDGWEVNEGMMLREVRRSVRMGEERPAEAWRRTHTDSTGRFVLGNVGAGEWELVASAPDFARSEPMVVAVERGQSVRDVEIVLEASGWVAGRVLEQDGKPVAGAEVVVSPRASSSASDAAQELAGQLAFALGDSSDAANAPRRTSADGEGRFEVRGLLPGAYDVKLARSRGHRIGGAMIFMGDGGSTINDASATRSVNVVANEEAYVELIRPPMGTLEGRVIAAGVPVEGTSVSMSEANNPFPFGADEVRTNEFGRFVFESVEPGEYKLSTVVPGAAMEESVTVDVEAGQSASADIIFGGATLSGRVMDADTGVGVPDVTLIVSPVSAVKQSAQFAFEMVTVSASGEGGMSMEIGGGSQSKVRSAADGSFEVRFLKPGKYTLQTTGGGYLDGEAGPVDVVDGEELDDLPIEVQRGASVTGVVRSGSTAKKLEGVPVRLASPNDVQMSMTGPDGSYAFTGLEAGDYTVSVLGSDFNSEPVASELVLLKKGDERTINLTTDG